MMPENTAEAQVRESASGTEVPLRVIAVTSGKGGVGKTNVTANVAVALASRGLRVGVLDADAGLANLDVLMGLSPTASLLHVLRGERRLAEILVDGPGGIRIIPAATGVEELTALTSADRLRLLDEMETLDGLFDVLLLDTAAGISGNVLWFNGAAAEILLVVNPEPTSLTDAYALVKVLAGRYGRREFLIVVNRATGQAQAEATFDRLARVTVRFLGTRLEYLGWIPDDDAVGRAIERQVPVVVGAPVAPASLALVRLAGRLATRPIAAPTGGSQFFFRRLLGEAHE